MDLKAILELVWSVINTPAGITAMAGLLLWGINRLYAAKPKWSAYEGAIISGIKFAEKAIPSTAPSAGLRKLDTALQYVIRVYEEANKRKPSWKTVNDLKEGIQITHAVLESDGNLSK